MNANAGKIIYGILSSDSNVTAIVPANRISPLVAEQGDALPFIVYDIVAQTPTNRKDGTSIKDRAFVQVSCYYDAEVDGVQAALDLAEVIRTSLDGYSGTVSAIYVQDIRYENGQTRYNSDSKIHQVDQDFMIAFNT